VDEGTQDKSVITVSILPISRQPQLTTERH